jgi:hypothetical protein
MTQLITNSRVAAYRTCPRLHQIQYVLGYRPVEQSYPLVWGTLLHALLEIWWLAWKDGNGADALEWALKYLAGVEDPYEAAKARAVITGYDLRWASAMVDIEVLAVEQEFRYDSGRGYHLGGKIDAIIKQAGKVLLVEHKNTSADLSAGSSYWPKLRMDSQASMYLRGAKALGYEPEGILWDALTRPDLRPYKATPVESRKYTKAGALYANQREADETPEEFGARIAASITPESYARAVVVRLPDELEEFDRDLQYLAGMCVQDSDEFAHTPRNPDACNRYGGTCAFFDVCSGSGTLNDERKFRKLDSVHPELDNPKP